MPNSFKLHIVMYKNYPIKTTDVRPMFALYSSQEN